MNSLVVAIGIILAVWVDGAAGPEGGTLAVTAVGFYLVCRILLEIRDKE